MARKCFYSFEYKTDNWRASKIKQIGAIEGNQTLSGNEWESVTSGKDPAIKKWIDDQMRGRTCLIVLVGATTANRKWINYEIEKAWDSKLGVCAVNIHNILDRNNDKSSKGLNPLSYITRGASLSGMAKIYDPPYQSSSDVYKYIADNIEGWAEESIKIRNRQP